MSSTQLHHIKGSRVIQESVIGGQEHRKILGLYQDKNLLVYIALKQDKQSEYVTELRLIHPRKILIVEYNIFYIIY